MTILFFLSACVMVGMLYVGLSNTLEWDPEKRIIGICTLTWAAIGIYLLMTQWMLATRHLPHILILATVLSTCGFIVGKTLTALLRRDWRETGYQK
jgi:hypothetical protein